MGAVASGTAGLADCTRWPEGDGWIVYLAGKIVQGFRVGLVYGRPLAALTLSMTVFLTT